MKYTRNIVYSKYQNEIINSIIRKIDIKQLKVFKNITKIL